MKYLWVQQLYGNAGDSVMPNGKISGTEMNSLNHYAYG